MVLTDELKHRIENIVGERKRTTAYFCEHSKAYRSFVEFEKAAFSPSALDAKTKELVAIGISVVTDCESCIEWHIRAALDRGANGREVLDAVDVGIEMGGGRASVSARFALAVLAYYEALPE